MPSLGELSARLERHPELQCISLQQLQKFLSLAVRVLPEIQQHAADHSADSTLILPEPIVNFLSAVLELDSASVKLCWIAFQDFVTEETKAMLSDDEALSSIGAHEGLGV